MKKIGIILSALAFALIVSSFKFSPNFKHEVDVREVVIGGHKYIIATSMKIGGSRYPGGVSIIHSAGCNCVKK